MNSISISHQCIIVIVKVPLIRRFPRINLLSLHTHHAYDDSHSAC
jgi:hypothetical protein